MSIQDLIAFADCIENISSAKAVKAYFIVGTEHSVGVNGNINLRNIIVDFGKIEKNIIAGALLFEKYNIQLLQDTIAEASKLLTSIYSKSIDDRENLTEYEIACRDSFCEKCRQIKADYLDLMECDLGLNGISKNQ